MAKQKQDKNLTKDQAEKKIQTLKKDLFNLVNIYESPRRYRKLGYINVLFLWFMNWLFIVIFKKTFSSKW